MDVVGTNDTGILVRKLRESRGMTQQELELAIDASFGHISRIESGRVNPSKETLLKIIKILNLNTREKDKLLGFEIHYPTIEEIDMAVEESRKYIDSCQNMAYVIHDYEFGYYCNLKVLKFIGFSKGLELFLGKYKGLNVMEMLFNERLAFHNTISKNEFDAIALEQIIQFMIHTEYPKVKDELWFIDLYSECAKSEKFKDLWNKALNLPKELMRESKKKIIVFNINGEDKPFYIVNIPLETPYFQIVEYIPIK